MIWRGTNAEKATRSQPPKHEKWKLFFMFRKIRKSLVSAVLEGRSGRYGLKKKNHKFFFLSLLNSFSFWWTGGRDTDLTLCKKTLFRKTCCVDFPLFHHACLNGIIVKYLMKVVCHVTRLCRDLLVHTGFICAWSDRENHSQTTDSVSYLLLTRTS